MWQYDWPAWSDRIKGDTGKWALERWCLMYLHEQNNVDALALEIKANLASQGCLAQVRVQSIWVDGTPQAEFSPKGHSPRIEQPQCELADLLLCVRWESPDGILQREQAMLIQAKVASKYNKIPGGKSTQKERLLFEECDRDKNITLYPGSTRKNPIGSYQLGSAAVKEYGLRDCASFLLMAKARWPNAEGSPGPLQVGWPRDKKKTEIKPPEPYLDAVIKMVCRTAPALGREVKTGPSAKHCAWTNMVNDLRGRYGKVKMTGYNEQPRVTTSVGKMSTRRFLSILATKHVFHGASGLHSTTPSPRSLKLLSVLNPSDWETLLAIKNILDPDDSIGWKYVLEIADLFGVLDREVLNLWNDGPPEPPPPDSNFNEGDGPYLPTLEITLRGDEQFQRFD